jgi:hypothetical protein
LTVVLAISLWGPIHHRAGDVGVGGSVEDVEKVEKKEQRRVTQEEGG